MNIMFLPRSAFSLKPLLLKSSKMNSHTEIEVFAARRGELSERRWAGWGKRVGEPTLEQNRFLATRPGPNPAFGKNRLELFEILHHDRLTINPLPESQEARQGRLPVGRLFRVWSTPTARMPSAVELLIFTGVARRTKGRVRACQRARYTGFFLRQISGWKVFTIW